MAQSAEFSSARKHKRFPQSLRVPEKWFDYKSFGEVFADTQIIAVKTPLKKEYNNGQSRGEGWVVDYQTGVCLEDEFTPQQLVERLHIERGLKLSAILDLTYTNRYYHHSEMKELGVSHMKIKCPGHDLPTDGVYSRFAAALREGLSSCDDPKTVVAVHCTHGINRTGYLVCRFLMEEKGFTPEAAISGFNKARGHDIERPNYLEHLRKGCPPLSSQSRSHTPPSSHSKPTTSYPTPPPPPPSHNPHKAQHTCSHVSQHSPHVRRHDQDGWHGNSSRSHGREAPTSWREPQPGVGGHGAYGPRVSEYWNYEPSYYGHDYSGSTVYNRHHPYWR